MRLFIDFPMLGRTSIIALWIAKILVQIGRSVATKFSVFVAGLYRSMQFSVTTCSLGFFLDSVTTGFDNVAIEF